MCMSKTKDKTNKDPYQKFLEKKHGGFETPGNLIGTIVKKATGSGLVKKERIIAGEVNEVYDVTTENDQNVIVRISRQGSQNFETEERVIRLALMAGVPAPKILLIEQISSSLEKPTFCVEEKIEGKPLTSLMGSLESGVLRSIISESGGILSKIHSITVDNFGHLDGTTSFKTWQDYIFSIEGRRDRIIAAAKRLRIEPELIDKAFRLLRENEKMFQIKEPKLLHGDFSPKHLLVKDNHITGIIDFEGAKGGDPVRDFAWLNFFYGDSFPIDWVKAGYDNKDLFDKNFDIKMKLYRLHLGLDLLEYYDSQKNESGLIHTKARFIKELENF